MVLLLFEVRDHVSNWLLLFKFVNCDGIKKAAEEQWRHLHSRDDVKIC